MASAVVLYTPQVLALATSLSQWPWDGTLPLQGEVRSRSCGSTLRLGLALDDGGRIARLGLQAQACAIGQAAAAVFAAHAIGLGGCDIAAAGGTLAAWLAGEGAMPDWPGLETIAAARDYPGRHGAVMLAWNAAMQLLPTA